MRNALLRFIPACIVGSMVRRFERLTKGEHLVEMALLQAIPTMSRRTKSAYVVGMVGLVGAGKSSVAREIAERIGAVVVSGDAIRIMLRAHGECLDRTRAIAENIAREIVLRGGNVVIDSDFIDANKRAALKAKLKSTKARIVYVRVHADIDMVLGRVMSTVHHASEFSEEFFSGASSCWNGDSAYKGGIVKLREMWRRTSHHYCWSDVGGGRWTLRKLSFPLFMTIDTTTLAWKGEVSDVVKRLEA